MKKEESKTRGRNRDRKQVAGKQKYEVSYEADKLGVHKSQIKKSIEENGNSRDLIESDFKKPQK